MSLIIAYSFVKIWSSDRIDRTSTFLGARVSLDSSKPESSKSCQVREGAEAKAHCCTQGGMCKRYMQLHGLLDVSIIRSVGPAGCQIALYVGVRGWIVVEAWVVRVMWVNASPVPPYTTTLTYSVQFQGSRHIQLYGIHGFGVLLLCVEINV